MVGAAAGVDAAAHIRIIYDINARFLQDIERRYPGDVEKQRRMSIIEEGFPKMVRMAHLAIVGAHAVNGVAAIQLGAAEDTGLPDFHQLWPTRFQNKTNGVTPRRWLHQARVARRSPRRNRPRTVA